MNRQKGDRYRPIVTVLKTKKGIPTVIEVSGRQYQYRLTGHTKRKGGNNHARTTNCGST